MIGPPELAQRPESDASNANGETQQEEIVRIPVYSRRTTIPGMASLAGRARASRCVIQTQYHIKGQPIRGTERLDMHLLPDTERHLQVQASSRGWREKGNLSVTQPTSSHLPAIGSSRRTTAILMFC